MINIALIGWPLLMILMAAILPWRNALIASLIGGYLLLPEQGGLDLPLLPPFEKDTIPSLVLFFLALVMRPDRPDAAGNAPGSGPGAEASALPGWIPRSATGTILLGMMVAGALLTALTNSDSLNFPETSYSIPGLTLYDGFSMIVRSVAVIVPILLGRKYLADPRAHRLLLIGLVVAGLGYSLLAIVEWRLSPQMNRWVYGFFPHSWHQHVRGDDSYRPLVFLNHGLLLAIFFAMTVLAAIGLSRAEPEARGRWLLAGLWLIMTLVLCRSLGAAIVAVALLPVVLFLSTRMQLVAAGLIAALILVYPLVRGAGLVPTSPIVSVVAQYNTGRALSLQFRLRNEEELLDRAYERPLFGWGPRGRNRVYDEFGRDQSVVDGAWIVALGQGGWFGYISEFGLLSFPLILLAVNRRRYDVGPATAALCVVLAANMIDMIPNAGRSPITWLIVGALLGRLELGRVTAGAASERDTAQTGASDPALAEDPITPYTRQTVRHDRTRQLRKS